MKKSFFLILVSGSFALFAMDKDRADDRRKIYKTCKVDTKKKPTVVLVGPDIKDNDPDYEPDSYKSKEVETKLSSKLSGKPASSRVLFPADSEIE